MKKQIHRPAMLMAGVAAAAMSLIATGAKAQDASAQATVGEDAGLSEIIVTATKRSENVQKVPIAVTVLSSDAIRGQNLVQTSDLVRLAPTVTFTNAPLALANSFTIRGIGTFATNSGLEPSVGVVVDGVPMARVIGSIGDLTDLDHVEVLNGPQGTLFGKNASAGVISLTTKAPAMGQSTFDGRASYASFNNIQLNGTVNVPLSDNIAARVTVFHNEHDGLTRSTATGKDYGDLNTSGVRAKVRFEPSSDFDFTLSGEATRHNENGLAPTVVALATTVPGYANTVAPFIAADLVSKGVVINHENRLTTTVRPDIQSYGDTRAIGGQFNYAIGTHTLTGLVSWRQTRNYDNFDSTGSGGPINFPDNLFSDRTDVRQTTAELRIASPSSGSLRYVVGVFFQHLNVDEIFNLDVQQSIAPSGSAPVMSPLGFLAIQSRVQEAANNYAAFGEATYDITDRLRFTAGARVAHDDISGTLDRTKPRLSPIFDGPPFTGFLTGPGNPFGPVSLSASKSYTNLSGRGSLQFDVTSDVMIYGTASRGYKGPGISFGYTSTPLVKGTVNPEIATSFEVGLKSTLFDRRLRLNISAYDTKLKDFQVSVPNIAEGQGAFTIVNAKQLKSTGVTADLDAKLTDAWTLSGAVAYTNARFTDFTNAGCYTGQTAAQGCINSVQTVNGLSLPNAPKWTLKGSTRYEIPVSDKASAFVQASASWQSKIRYSTDGDENLSQKGYAIINLLAGLKSEDGKYQLSVFANNLFDQHYLSRISVTGQGSYYVANQVIGAYRSIGVALDVHY